MTAREQKNLLISELKKHEMTVHDICKLFNVKYIKKNKTVDLKMLIDSLTNEVLLYEDEIKKGKRTITVYGILPPDA